MINLRDFNPVGDGIADDTVKVQDWLDAAHESDADLYAPTGKYRVVGQRVRSGLSFSIRGDGRGLTRFLFEGATAGFSFAPGSIGRTFQARDFSIISKATAQGFGLEVILPVAGSVYWHQVGIEGIEIVPDSPGGPYWTYGLVLRNVWNARLQDLTIAGRGPGFMSAAIWLGGTSTDTKIIAPRISDCSKGIETDPPGVCEGLHVVCPTMVNVDYGVYRVQAGAGSALLTEVNGGHINARRGGVYLDTSHQSTIRGVLIYRDGPDPFVGIHVLRSNDARIAHNQVIRAGPDGTENGIVVQDSLNGIVTGNLTVLMDTGIWLQDLCRDTSVIGNRGNVNGTHVLDQGAGNYKADNVPA